MECVMRKATAQELGKIFFLCGFLALVVLGMLLCLWMLTERILWTLSIGGFVLILLSFVFLSYGSREGNK